MESIDSVSLMSLIVAGGVLAIDLIKVPLPTNVTQMLSNQVFKVVVGVAVVVASYYHLPTAIILAAVLYLSLNQHSNSVSNAIKVSSTQVATKESEQPGSHTVLNLPPGEINNTGAPGFYSNPNLEPSEFPLPTQDNSAPVATDASDASDAGDATQNQDNIESVIAFGGNDMAPSL